jgi:hypothetical protein
LTARRFVWNAISSITPVMRAISSDERAGGGVPATSAAGKAASARTGNGRRRSIGQSRNVVTGADHGTTRLTRA